MMEVTFKESNNTSTNKIICDTNVWYDIAEERITPPVDFALVPTMLTLIELATSEKMVHEIELYQRSIKAVYDFGKSIIPVHPFDFILHNNDPNYPWENELTQKILTDFSKLLTTDIEERIEISETIKTKTIEISRQNRIGTLEFAEFANDTIKQVRLSLSKKDKILRLKQDTTEINREMVKSFLTYHAEKKNYTVDFKSFDWSRIELFMCVTENFFKKLETDSGKKVKPNDCVDWLNMLYVMPGNKYLTFDKSWKDYILADERVKHYLYLGGKSK